MQCAEPPDSTIYGYADSGVELLAEASSLTINWLPPSGLSDDQWDSNSPYCGFQAYMEGFTTHSGISEQGLQYYNDTEPATTMIEMSPPEIGAVRSTNSTRHRAEAEMSHTPNSHSNQSICSQSSSSNYYVDGAGAREPRYGKLGRQNSTCEPNLHFETRTGSDDKYFSFPTTIEQYTSYNFSRGWRYTVSEQTYSDLVLHFGQGHHSFESDYFPTLGVVNLSVHLYFEHFHPIFPLLHKAWFAQRAPWLLILATSAIGIHYLGTDEARQCSEAFQEFLHDELEKDDCLRVPYYFSNADDQLRGGDRGYQTLIKIQALILNIIGMSHCRREILVEHAYSGRSKLVAICLRNEMLCYSGDSSPRGAQSYSGEISWIRWIINELSKRAGYCIWLLDCMMAYESDFRPQMNLDDAEALMPCREDIWEALDESEWRALFDSYNGTQSLLRSIEVLYNEKSVDLHSGEFGRILLIHGFYHRI
ncbi:hypothetical protein F5884DRAFT_135744 [Xylogone sp. PMI_703]|nr:hypothetical protein F5884DRAFT_135744 [Xylogone sp. PMI_703]